MINYAKTTTPIQCGSSTYKRDIKTLYCKNPKAKLKPDYAIF